MSKIAALCLLSVVFGEARGEPEIGKQAVAAVVVNRSVRSGSGICDTVMEKQQFKPRRPTGTFSFSYKGKDPTGGALYFRNYPGPWKGKRFLKRIGGHYFYE